MTVTGLSQGRYALNEQVSDKKRTKLKTSLPIVTPWREPLSIRQVNSLFEGAVMPGLVHRLQRLFHDFGNEDREETVQDCICQALEIYRALKLYMAGGKSRSLVSFSFALADHVASRYLAGTRFASPHAESRL